MRVFSTNEMKVYNANQMKVYIVQIKLKILPDNNTFISGIPDPFALGPIKINIKR